MSSLSDVVKKGFEQMNRGDFASSFSEQLGSAIAQHFSEMKTEYPDLAYHVRTSVDRGNNVAFDWVATSTHAPSGRQVSWTGTGVVHVLNGRILAARINHDSKLRRDLQLSLAPRVGFGPLTGTWRAQVLGLRINMDLSHDEDGVWGAADIENLGASKFEGILADKSISFKVVLPDGAEHAFQGTLTDANTVVGRIEGLDEAITFSRS